MRLKLVPAMADNVSMELLWKVTRRIGGTDQMAEWDRGYEAYDRWSKAFLRGKPYGSLAFLVIVGILHAELQQQLEENDSQGPSMPPYCFSISFLHPGHPISAKCIMCQSMAVQIGIQWPSWYSLPHQLSSVGIYNASCFFISCLPISDHAK
jgi:hypothetical protein